MPAVFYPGNFVRSICQPGFVAADIKKILKKVYGIFTRYGKKKQGKTISCRIEKKPVFSGKIPIAFLKTCYYNSKCTSIRGTFLRQRQKQKQGR